MFSAPRRTRVQFAPTEKRKIKHEQTEHFTSMSIRDFPKSDTWPDPQYSDNLRTVSTLYAATRPADDNEDTEWEYQRGTPSHLGYTVLDTFHDPFMGGGQGLTERQLSLNHIYMHSLAPTLMGCPKKESPYSPGVYITQLCLENSSAAAIWTSILAEEIISRMSGLPRTAEMATHRVAGNRALRVALTNFRTDFQAAYLALLKAAQVALFLGDTEALYTHFLATEMAIEAVGGLKNALALTPDIEPVYISSFPFYEACIPTAKSLNQVTSRFLHSVQWILQHGAGEDRSSFGCRISDILEEPRAADDDLNLEDEIITSLGPWITPFANPSTSNLKPTLMLLIELCWTFIVLRSDPGVRAETLRFIKLLLDNCCRSRGDLQDRDATCRTRAAMISHARREKSNYHSLHQRQQSDLFITQMEIDGLKIFYYHVVPGRAAIVAKLYSWLTRDSLNKGPFSAGELEILQNQIVQGWMEHHTSRF